MGCKLNLHIVLHDLILQTEPAVLINTYTFGGHTMLDRLHIPLITVWDVFRSNHPTITIALYARQCKIEGSDC